LNLNGICLNNSEDQLVWSWDLSVGQIKAKLAYKAIANSDMEKDIRWCSISISKWHIPNKLKCFAWLVLHNKILIWQNLQKRRFAGPNYCYLYREHDESVDYLYWMPIC